MSGYLQRLVGNAMTPARSIHPAVGSIFSPPKEERIAGSADGIRGDRDDSGVAPNLARPLLQPTPPRTVRAHASPEGEPRQAAHDPEQRLQPFQPIAPIPRRTAPRVGTPRKTAPPVEEPGPLRNSEAEPQPIIHAEADEAYTPLLPPAAQSDGRRGRNFSTVADGRIEERNVRRTAPRQRVRAGARRDPDPYRPDRGDGRTPDRAPPGSSSPE